MGTASYQGSFTMSTFTGNQSITGVGFKPDVVIFWSEQIISRNGGNEVRRFIGAASAETERWSMVSSVSPFNNYRSRQMFNNLCIRWNDANNTNAIIQADFVSMDSDGFTINVVTGSAVPIYYLAVGGLSFSAKVGYFDIPSTAQQTTQSISGVGFVPKAVMFVHGVQTNNSNGTLGASDSSDGFSIGFTAGTGTTDQEVTIQFFHDLPVTVGTSARQGSCLGVLGFNANGWDLRSHLSSFDADGFTLFHDVKLSTTTVRTFYIAMGGTANFKVGAITEPSVTGTQSITTSGVKTVAQIFTSAGTSTSNATITNSESRSFFGATVNANQSTGMSFYLPSGTATATGLNGGITSDTLDRYTTSFDSVAKFVSHDTFGFTVNWTSVSGTSIRFPYLAIGEPIGSPARMMMSCFN